MCQCVICLLVKINGHLHVLLPVHQPCCHSRCCFLQCSLCVYYTIIIIVIIHELQTSVSVYVSLCTETEELLMRIAVTWCEYVEC